MIAEHEHRVLDLIAVKGDPLEDVAILEDVRFVMIAGRVVKSSDGAHP